MTQDDSIGGRRTAREQASLFSRYMSGSEDSGALRVEVGVDGRGTDVESELLDPEAEDAVDRVTAGPPPRPGRTAPLPPRPPA